MPLAPMTTLGIGGPARFFLNAESIENVRSGLEFAASRGIDVFVMGGGSNLLISDEGIDALVLQVGIGGLEFEEGPDGRVQITAGAGLQWDDIVAECVSRSLAGLECLSGIPGLIGGTPIQNVGAYGQEVSETIVNVSCLDRSTGALVGLSNSECGFSYRSSIFNSVMRDRYIVLSVTYELVYGGPPKVVYRDLMEHFAGRTFNLKEVRDAVLQIRRSKSMVIDPTDPNSRSAGSFFKNPVLEPADFEVLDERFGPMPFFPFNERVKIPAAWLIENSGFGKGFKMGRVGLSTNHTLALVNLGSATASDVIALKEAIQESVSVKFGIALLPEPVFVGFEI